MSFSIHEAYFSVNFEHLSKFNPELQLDEIIAFQYMAWKCYTNNGTWFHSIAAIGNELRINKHRLRTIIASFEKREWLSVETGGRRNISHYRVNFSVLATDKFIKAFFSPNLNKAEVTEIKNIFSQISKLNKVNDRPPKKALSSTKFENNEAEVRALAKTLENLFVERRESYNKGNHPRKLAPYKVKFTEAHLKSLDKALDHFGGAEIIQSAFISYSDHINYNAGGDIEKINGIAFRPKADLLSYFLSPRKDFSVITTFVTQYFNYGSENKDYKP